MRKYKKILAMLVALSILGQSTGYAATVAGDRSGYLPYAGTITLDEEGEYRISAYALGKNGNQSVISTRVIEYSSVEGATRSGYEDYVTPINLDEDGEYKILAYTEGVDGTTSETVSKDVTLKRGWWPWSGRAVDLPSGKYRISAYTKGKNGKASPVSTVECTIASDWTLYDGPITLEDGVYKISAYSFGENTLKSLTRSVLVGVNTGYKDYIDPLWLENGTYEITAIQLGKNMHKSDPALLKLTVDTQMLPWGGPPSNRWATDSLHLEDGEYDITAVQEAVLDGETLTSQPSKAYPKIDTVKPAQPTLIVPTGWMKTYATFNVSGGTDDRSGVSGYNYWFEGEDGTVVQGEKFRYAGEVVSDVINREGKTLLKAYTIDNAGNKSDTAYKLIKICNTPPNKPVLITPGTGWLKSSDVIRVNVEATTTVAELAYTEYKIVRVIGGEETLINDWVRAEGFSFPIAGEGELKAYVRVTDAAGFTSEVAEATVKIDNVRPTKPTIISDLTWQKDKATLTVLPGTDAESGVDHVEYAFSLNGPWYTYSAATEITGEGETKVYAVTVDKAGNRSEYALGAILIDSAAPTAPNLIGETDWTNKESVSVNIVHGRDAYGTHASSGVAYTEYELAGATVASAAQIPKQESNRYITISNEGETTITARTYDVVGHVSETATLVVRLDRTAPHEATITVPTGWSSTAINLPVVQDMSDMSGIKSMEYTLDGTTWTAFGDAAAAGVVTVTIPISAEGATAFKTRVKDNAGNTTISTVTGGDGDGKVKIDTEAPSGMEIDTSALVAAGYTGDGSWVNSALLPNPLVVVRHTGENSLSGKVGKVTYNGILQTDLPYGETRPIALPTNEGGNDTTQTISAYAVSGSGLTSATVAKTVKIDNNNPTAPGILANTDWSKEPVTATFVDSTDTFNGIPGSGIKEYQFRTRYSDSESEGEFSDWQSISGITPITLSADGIIDIEAKAVDNVGRESTVAAQTVRVDATAPMLLSALLDEGTYRASSVNVTLTVEAKDNFALDHIEVVSGVKTYNIPCGGAKTYSGSIPIELTAGDGVKTVMLRVYDGAGNIATGEASIRLLANVASYANDSVKYRFSIEGPDGYSKNITGNMSRAATSDTRYYKSIVVPDDAPIGSLVYAQFTGQRKLGTGEIVYDYLPGPTEDEMTLVGTIQTQFVAIVPDDILVDDDVRYYVKIVDEAGGSGYETIVDDVMGHDAVDLVKHTITLNIPDDAPTGATVYLRAEAERYYNETESLTAYWPGADNTGWRKIGTIDGTILKKIVFSSKQ